MINFLKKVVAAVRAALLMDKALGERAHSRFEASMAHITKIYDVLGAKMPSAIATIDMNLLCATVAFNVKQYMLSIEAIGVVLDQTDNASYLSDQDKNYIRYYCRGLQELCEARADLETPYSRSMDIEFNSLQFDAVRADLKRLFPITG